MTGDSNNKIHRLTLTDKLQKYAFRTYKQLFLHTLGAFILALIVGVFWGNNLCITSNSFVTIISSVSAISGVLLAVTLTVAIFYSRYVTDWSDRLIRKLKEDQEKMEKQMEKSARMHPEISNRLSGLYMKAAFYIPGQKLEESEIYEADRVFSDWVKEQARRSTRKFSFGDLDTYDSFEKHLFDAQLKNTELRHTLIDLHLVERAGSTIITFSPLIITWVIITVFTLVFAIIGAVSAIPSFLHIPILLIPFYLVVVAMFALTKDITGMLRYMRLKETATEQAMMEFNAMITRESEDRK